MAVFFHKFLNFTFLLVAILLFTGSECQTTDVVTSQVLTTLGDHSDRITNLEHLVSTLSSRFTSLQNDMKHLVVENHDLRDQIQNLTQNFQTCGCGNTPKMEETTPMYMSSTQEYTTYPQQGTGSMLTSMSQYSNMPSYSPPMGGTGTMDSSSPQPDMTSYTPMITGTGTMEPSSPQPYVTSYPSSMGPDMTSYTPMITGTGTLEPSSPQPYVTSYPSSMGPDMPSYSPPMGSTDNMETSSPQPYVTSYSSSMGPDMTSYPSPMGSTDNMETSSPQPYVTSYPSSMGPDMTSYPSQMGSTDNMETSSPQPYVTSYSSFPVSMVTTDTMPVSSSNTVDTTFAPATSDTPLPATTTTPKPLETTTQEQVFDSCEEAMAPGGATERVVKLRIARSSDVIDVVCKLGEGKVWIVIQRRVDGSVDFNRDWNSYKHGFGNVTTDREFWLGNDNIFKLTSSADYLLRIDMTDWDNRKVYAEYGHFSIRSEINYYRLTAGSYHGTAGDSFHYHGSYMLQHYQMAFSTPDMDHDLSTQNCAKELNGGWWFNNCYSSNLNGEYLYQPYGQRATGESSGQPPIEGTGIEWYPYKQRQYSMAKVEMKMTTSPSSFIG